VRRLGFALEGGLQVLEEMLKDAPPEVAAMLRNMPPDMLEMILSMGGFDDDFEDEEDFF
jgi:hypothetical protein